MEKKAEEYWLVRKVNEKIKKAWRDINMAHMRTIRYIDNS